MGEGTYDLVIVGGGIAGLCAALAAPDGARIVVIDKGEAGAGSSPLAQGGMAAAVAVADSPALHAADTIAAGAGLCDEPTVRDICSAGPGVVAWLTSLGCDFDHDGTGALDLAREGGQRVARSVHWRDATGAEIVRALREAVRARNVERVTDPAVALIVSEGRCVGVRTSHGIFLGRATLLATGGAGGLWGRTTNALGATGDGVWLAARAGAQVADLEFMQFHPTALDAGEGQRVLLTEALRGDGALLVDARGERFVEELAPRHVVTAAILAHAPVSLDLRPVRHLEQRFPTVVAGLARHGIDPADGPVPVAPAAHYFIGGVAADAHGATSIPGLFAAGECAATGMHGANRMAGNSLLETVVAGRRVGARAMAEQLPPTDLMFTMQIIEWLPVDPEIPRIMWEQVGPIRDTDGLTTAIARLDALAPTPHRNLSLMIARAALARAESRGVHLRSDAPESDPSFAQRSFDHAVGRVSH